MEALKEVYQLGGFILPYLSYTDPQQNMMKSLNHHFHRLPFLHHLPSELLEHSMPARPADPELKTAY